MLTGTKADEWDTMAVLNNDSDVAKEITIPVQTRAATGWVVIANGESAGVTSLGEVSGSVVNVPAYTTMILVDRESFEAVAVTSDKGKVIVNYVIKDSGQKLRESITLQGTPGTNYAVPGNIKIPSGYAFLSQTGNKRGVYTSDTQTVTYYYEAINPDTVVDGIKNNGVYCKNAKFKVTSPDYTQVMAGNKILTPDADGAYTVSAADSTQTIALTDSEGYSIYLSITVNADHTINNSDCTKESTCSVCQQIFPAQTSHRFSATWTKDDTSHWKVCENDGCTVTTTKTKHSGTDDGDCTTPVICECGEVVTAAEAEHIYDEWKSNGNGTHTRKCITAGCTKVETENCAGGEATCKKRAVCTECNAEYGTLNLANHNGNEVWEQTAETHQKKYDCCDKEVSVSEAHDWENGVCKVCNYQCGHTGGNATCVKKALCTICGEEYGTYNMSIHEDLHLVAAKEATMTDEGNIEYWYCNACDRYYIRQDGLVEIEKSQTVIAKLKDTTPPADVTPPEDITPPADTTSPADITPATDTDKEAKAEAVKEQTPGTGDDKRTLAWLLMFVIGGAGVIVFGKKNKFTDKI